MPHKAAQCQAQGLATGQANMHSTLKQFRCALPLMPYGYCHHRGIHSDCFQVCCPDCTHWHTEGAFFLSPFLTAPHRFWCVNLYALVIIRDGASLTSCPRVAALLASWGWAPPASVQLAGGQGSLGNLGWLG